MGSAIAKLIIRSLQVTIYLLLIPIAYLYKNQTYFDDKVNLSPITEIPCNFECGVGHFLYVNPDSREYFC